MGLPSHTYDATPVSRPQVYKYHAAINSGMQAQKGRLTKCTLFSRIPISNQVFVLPSLPAVEMKDMGLDAQLDFLWTVFYCY